MLVGARDFAVQRTAIGILRRTRALTLPRCASGTADASLRATLPSAARPIAPETYKGRSWAWRCFIDAFKAEIAGVSISRLPWACTAKAIIQLSRPAVSQRIHPGTP